MGRPSVTSLDSGQRTRLPSQNLPWDLEEATVRFGDPPPSINGDRDEDSGDRDEDSGDRDEDSGDRDEDSGDRDEDSGDRDEDSGDRDEDSGDRDEDTAFSASGESVAAYENNHVWGKKRRIFKEYECCSLTSARAALTTSAVFQKAESFGVQI
ncbi:hypothetical protein TREES_T100007540 [Tupaia chinensis]|uniref:Uncharacterized protein n=1 Tax=Tupaia chinensis TaxID=246437 RepID=L9KV90_TUPCH|nr:hypothetical protein TREES_T100007540 [Tupaia chinensis]